MSTSISEFPWRGTMVVDPRGFIVVSWPDHHVVTREDALKSIEVLHGLNAQHGGKLHPLLCDISNIRELSIEARRIYSTGEGTCAVALLGGSPIGNIIGNIFLAVISKPIPVKLFRSRDAAIEWLLSLNAG